MKIVMKKTAAMKQFLLLSTVACLVGAIGNAQAGFLDERGAAVAAQASQAKGRLIGDFSSSDWNQQAPASAANGSALSLAIIRLLPINRPAVEIDAPSNLVDLLVRWTPGITRKQALEEIAAKNGVNITIDSRAITVRPIGGGQVAASIANTGTSVARPAGVGVPAVAGSVRTFEVRLADIKLSTAMARWATDTGVRLRWDADKHVLVGAPMTFTANSAFEAVAQALSTPGIKNSEYPLEVCEYPNQPPLLRVTRQGEQAKDCPQVVPVGGAQAGIQHPGAIKR